VWLPVAEKTISLYSYNNNNNLKATVTPYLQNCKKMAQNQVSKTKSDRQIKIILTTQTRVHQNR